MKKDVEETLGLNTGDLPELREAAWKAFVDEAEAHAGKRFGNDARRAYLDTWRRKDSPKLPPLLGVIEAKLR